MWPFARDKLVVPGPAECLPGRAVMMPVPERHFVNGHALVGPDPEGLEKAVFGLGCFWGAERVFWQAPGVWVTAVGYAGGSTPNPTYEEVCSGRTGHTGAEQALELAAEIAGERVHSGPPGAGFGVGVVVRVGVDVVGVESAGAVSDELDPGDADVVGGQKRLVAARQSGVEIVDDRELRARLFTGRARRIADGADIGRAQLEPVAGVDLDRIHEPPADELGAGDQRHRRPDVLLQQVQTIDRRLVIRSIEITGKCVGS